MMLFLMKKVQVRSSIYLLLKISILFLLICNGVIYIGAQSLEQHPIRQVSGKKFTRYNYNEEGKLVNRQSFRVGEVQKQRRSFYIPIYIKFYDDEDQLKDSAKTRFYCRPEHSRMVLNILPFTSGVSHKKVRIKAMNGAYLYPSHPSPHQLLPDRRFKLSVLTGMMYLLGSKTIVEIYDRQVVEVQPAQDRYKINSEITLHTYLWGVPFYDIHYEVVEWLSETKGLLKQKFINSQGSYFIIRAT